MTNDNGRERRGLLRRTEGLLATAEKHTRGAGLALAEALEALDADLVGAGTRLTELNEAGLLGTGQVLEAVRQRRRRAEGAVRRADDALAEAERLLGDEAGQGLAECALLLVLIAAVCIVFLIPLGGVIAGVFQQITDALRGGVAVGGPPAG